MPSAHRLAGQVLARRGRIQRVARIDGLDRRVRAECQGCAAGRQLMERRGGTRASPPVPIRRPPVAHQVRRLHTADDAVAARIRQLLGRAALDVLDPMGHGQVPMRCATQDVECERHRGVADRVHRAGDTGRCRACDVPLEALRVEHAHAPVRAVLVRLAHPGSTGAERPVEEHLHGAEPDHVVAETALQPETDHVIQVVEPDVLQHAQAQAVGRAQPLQHEERLRLEDVDAWKRMHAGDAQAVQRRLRVRDGVEHVFEHGRRAHACNELDGVLEQHAGRVSRGIAHDPPVRRIGRLLVDAGESQCRAVRPHCVHVVAVQHGRTVGDRTIEELALRVGTAPVVRVPADPAHPLLDRPLGGMGGGHAGDLRGRAGAGEVGMGTGERPVEQVDVCVRESGCERRAGQVADLCVRMVGSQLGRAAHAGDAAAVQEDCIGAGIGIGRHRMNPIGDEELRPRLGHRQQCLLARRTCDGHSWPPNPTSGRGGAQTSVVPGRGGDAQRNQMEYIRRSDRLTALGERLQGVPLLAIDTEAAGYHRYHDRICLLQLSTRTETFVVDTLELSDVAPLTPILASADTEIVLHDADYDLRLLARDYGIRVRRLFDTKIAAQLLGEPQIGLASLLEKYRDVRLDKKHQRADWAQRPLPPDMIAYAAEDTRHLPALRDTLRAQLEERGRLHWAEEEFALRVQVDAASATPDPDAYLRLKNIRDLKPRQLAALRELHGWREAAASERDVAPFRVVNNEVIVEVARRLPERPDQLRGIPGLGDALIRRRGADFLDAVARARALGEEDLPVRRRGPPRPPPDAAFDALVDRLKGVRDAAAERLGLERGFLMPRQQLEDIARGRPATLEELRTVADIRAWQVEALGEDLLAAVARPGPS